MTNKPLLNVVEEVKIPIMDVVEENLVGAVFMLFHKRYLNAASLANCAYRPLRELLVKKRDLPVIEQDFIQDIYPNLAREWKEFRESIWHASDGVLQLNPADIVVIIHAACMEVIRLREGKLRGELELFMAWCSAAWQNAPNDHLKQLGQLQFPSLHELPLKEQFVEGMRVLQNRYPHTFS